MKKLKRQQDINELDSLNQLLILKAICAQIYVARNISLSPERIEEQMKKIDELFRDKDNFN